MEHEPGKSVVQVADACLVEGLKRKLVRVLLAPGRPILLQTRRQQGCQAATLVISLRQQVPRRSPGRRAALLLPRSTCQQGPPGSARRSPAQPTCQVLCEELLHDVGGQVGIQRRLAGIPATSGRSRGNAQADLGPCWQPGTHVALHTGGMPMAGREPRRHCVPNKERLHSWQPGQFAAAGAAGRSVQLANGRLVACWLRTGAFLTWPPGTRCSRWMHACPRGIPTAQTP